MAASPSASELLRGDRPELAWEVRARQSRNTTRRRWLAGAGIASAVLAGVYATANVAATSMATRLNASDPTRPADLAEFTPAGGQASADHRAARAKCDLLARWKQPACNAAARARADHAMRNARVY